jgi:heme exporter protein D
MDEVTGFFQMGGYAAFVWPALGLTVAIMGGLLIATLRQLRERQRRLAELEAAGAQRRRRAARAGTAEVRPGAQEVRS